MTDQQPTSVQALVRAQFDRQVAHYLQEVRWPIRGSWS
jgi:hypothetical protein